MIRKLRIKFVAIAMLSVFLVLSVILGIINVLNYQRIVANADMILEILVENNGAFPTDIWDEDKPEIPTPNETSQFQPRDLNEETPEKVNPRGNVPEDNVPEDNVPGDNIPGGGTPMSPELPFESRYFTVVIESATGKIISSDTGKIAAIDEPEAREYGVQAWKESSEQDFIDDYRYKKQTIGENVLIVFLDCGRSMDTFYAFLRISLIVAFGGMLAVFCLVFLFSKRIIAPVSESYEKQKRFITDAGHEIKTPLTIIHADAEVLEMDLGQNEWIADIKRQTVKLKNLTNNLIYLSKMEELEEPAQMGEFSISELADEIASSFQSLAITQNKTFDCDVEAGIQYRGDTASIQKLFSILLDNALKYSPEGGHISMKLYSTGKNLTFSVYNTTEQIAKENVPLIFERFYRLDESHNSQSGGYGIGLSIAKAIVQMHHGKISAQTEDGKSLLITIVL